MEGPSSCARCRAEAEGRVEGRHDIRRRLFRKNGVQYIYGVCERNVSKIDSIDYFVLFQVLFEDESRLELKRDSIFSLSEVIPRKIATKLVGAEDGKCQSWCSNCSVSVVRERHEEQRAPVRLGATATGQETGQEENIRG